MIQQSQWSLWSRLGNLRKCKRNNQKAIFTNKCPLAKCGINTSSVIWPCVPSPNKTSSPEKYLDLNNGYACIQELKPKSCIIDRKSAHTSIILWTTRQWWQLSILSSWNKTPTTCSIASPLKSYQIACGNRFVTHLLQPRLAASYSINS
jgi:hypothetical protein